MLDKLYQELFTRKEALQGTDIGQFEKNVAQEHKNSNPVLTANFQQEVENLFISRRYLGLEIPPKAIMDGLSAGFDYFHDLGKTNPVQEQKARVFLEAMGYANRKRGDARLNYVKAVEIMVDYALVEVKENFDENYPNLTGRKTSPDHFQEIKVTINGVDKRFPGYDTALRTTGGFGKVLDRVVQVSETLLK